MKPTPMKPVMSAAMMRDVSDCVRASARTCSTLNVPVVAEQIRRRHLGDNVALEDIVSTLLFHAQLESVVIEFDSAALDIRPAEGESQALPPRIAAIMLQS